MSHLMWGIFCFTQAIPLLRQKILSIALLRTNVECFKVSLQLFYCHVMQFLFTHVYASPYYNIFVVQGMDFDKK